MTPELITNTAASLGPFPESIDHVTMAMRLPPVLGNRPKGNFESTPPKALVAENQKS